MKTKIIIASTLLILITIISGCEKSPVDPEKKEVLMINKAFSPSSLTVSLNSTVTWTNTDNVDHNVISTSGLFSSGTISSGNNYSHQFTSMGTYAYTCTLHSNMNGTIIVN